LDIYLSCLIGGTIALAILALCGIGFHHAGVQVGHGHTSTTAAHTHVGHSVRGHVHQGHSQNAADRSDGGSIFRLLGWLSPVYICGAIVGFGATGTLVSPIFQGWLQFGAALVGAYVLCSFCIRPMLTGIQKWASLPAKTLSDAIFENGTAVTDFDAKGYGLVRLNLDGQVVQLLGQLDPEEQSGSPVRSGEALFVRSVDSARQRCVVCRTSGSVFVRQ
jgi:hypothetical protein